MKKLILLLVALLSFCLFAVPVFAGDVFRTLHTPDWVHLALEATGFFALLTNLTKTDKDDKALGFISKLVHFLAGSFKVSGLK